MRWSPLSIAAVVSTFIVVLRRDDTAATSVEAASILLAGAVGFALDDPAFEVLDPSPTTLRTRRLARAAAMVATALAVWATLVVVHGPADSHEAWAFVAMFGGLLGLSLAIAGVLGRDLMPGRPGPAVAPVLLVAIIMSTIVPPRWRPFPLGDVPGGWQAIYVRWGSTAIIGLLVFTWSSRDRARRRTRRLSQSTS